MKVKLTYLDNQIAKLTLNRPEYKNAVDFEVIEQMNHHLDEIAANDEVSVVWIGGEGGAFCSGGDLHAFHSLQTAEEAKKMLLPMCGVLKKIVALQAVTVSYLDGPAIGGGAEIACATDFTLANSKGKAGFVQAKLAITTGWGGSSLLQRRVGYHHALQMLSSGSIYRLNELLSLKFVHEEVDNEQGVIDWCENLLQHKNVVKSYKKNLFSEMQQQQLFAAMDEEVDRCAILWESSAHHEAVAKFKSRR
ncbi:enoyl-CoA hydratase [Salipaludibacillus keqinensis]|uniref:Enoyl-CoA hydratase n=1 Tax=Salipaludibacillus keqinensis TaxID=2045207 RepID=A0A323TH70_9BACI|nr:enoyl-CoA hydratase/isomerase family protein [Salipaludibacillus keqinensis]PYZ93254.1 enoyl-CoA hydratase [Salipaludibacillus keqinensis]